MKQPFPLRRSHLPIFAFLTVIWGISSKIFIAMTVSRFSPFLPSSGFEVSGHMFKLLILLSWFIVCGVRQGSIFILMHVQVSFPQYHLLKRQFSYKHSQQPWQRSISYKCIGLFWSFLPCSSGFLCLFLCQYHKALISTVLVVCFEVIWCMLLALFFV